MQSKLRETSLKQTYDRDLYKKSLDSKFKSLISSREHEWETAWAKREELLTHKDQKLHSLEVELARTREALSKREFEVEHFQSQMQQMVADHAKINDEMKARAHSGERRYEELVKQCQRNDEQTRQRHATEVQEIRESLTSRYEEEIRRLNEMLTEAKDKGKRKQAELSQQINEII